MDLLNTSCPTIAIDCKPWSTYTMEQYCYIHPMQEDVQYRYLRPAARRRNTSPQSTLGVKTLGTARFPSAQRSQHHPEDA